MINIEPEEDEDPPGINPHSQGKLRIAVLSTDAFESTDAFDATRIDSDKVHFGPFMASPYHAVEEDVNGDGLFDLLLKFHSRDTGIQCGDTFAELTAETFPTLRPDGTCIVQEIIRGDTFQTVQCRSE
jgi:hypothetical protein